jgi:hypothetical protein
MAATFTGRLGQNALVFTQHLVDIRYSGAVCMNQWRMMHLAGGGAEGQQLMGLLCDVDVLATSVSWRKKTDGSSVWTRRDGGGRNDGKGVKTKTYLGTVHRTVRCCYKHQVRGQHTDSEAGGIDCDMRVRMQPGREVERSSYSGTCQLSMACRWSPSVRLYLCT